jgi:hypothetical protein
MPYRDVEDHTEWKVTVERDSAAFALRSEAQQTSAPLPGL